jgi:hypothetical protein
MVSLLTLSYLLTGTVYPNSWTRFSSESMGMFTEGFYRPRQPDDAIFKPVSHATPDHVFAQISRNGDITMVPRSIGRPTSCGSAIQVDNTVRRPWRRVAVHSFVTLVQVSLLVQVRMPHDTPHGARCSVTSGITLARHLEAAGRAAQVQMWSLAHTTPDATTWGTKRDWDARHQREAHLSSFDLRPGGGPLLHSAEFACPPPSQSLQTFEVSCAGGVDEDGRCAVDVWQDLFRVEIRV